MIEVSIAIVFFVGVLLLLQKHLFSIVVGLLLIGNGVNLALYYLSDPLPHAASFILNEETVKTSAVNDPVPQALVLTAIVIGFALLTFLTALAVKLLNLGVGIDLKEIEAEDT